MKLSSRAALRDLLESLPSRERGLKLPHSSPRFGRCLVAPLAGAWIETGAGGRFCYHPSVAPLAGAWIETGGPVNRRRGGVVAPLAGAWIETGLVATESGLSSVAPLAGAWIETYRLETWY